MKFGVCGTAQWAERVHLGGLAANPEVTLVGVCGRNAARRRELADSFGIRPYETLTAMLADVEAVSFAVPPAVQAEYAREAAAAGKHLLLEKPIAQTLAGAERLLAEISRTGVSALCFLTRNYIPLVRDFIVRARAASPERGTASFRSGALLAGPYAGSPWRQDEFGALWDGAPHSMSVLCAVLGPVAEIAGARQDDNGLRLSLRHRDGRQSDVLVNLRDATTELDERYEFTGSREPVTLDSYVYDRPTVYAGASNELLAAARAGEPHPSMRLALHLVAVAEAAEHTLRTGTARPVAETAGADAIATWPEA